MDRREFLHRAGASATAAGLAGCLGTAALDSSSPNDANPDSDDDCETPEKSSSDDFSGVESDADEPFREVSIGDRNDVAFPENNRPRTLRVWNAADEDRTVDLRIARGDDRRFDEAVEFPPDAYLTATLAEPADYRASVAVAGGGVEDACDSESDANATGIESAEGAAVPISRSSFDCNHATVDVGVMADGSVETVETATAMGCPTPRIADSTFSVERGDCGTDHRASVDFDGERVRVEGAVRTPTPQWTLELAADEYDPDADRLDVRVRAVESDEDGDEAGVQCVAEVPYEATVDFEHALPGEASVVHETNEEPIEVTRTSRPSGD